MRASWEDTHLPTTLSKNELGNIYNADEFADEFGLFY